MSPSRWVRLSAYMAVIVTLATHVAPAFAQVPLDEAREQLDLWPDPIARSPRLLGMGRLSLVIDEPNNQLTFWDFGRLTAGVQESDSGSVVEIRPATTGVSAKRDAVLGSFTGPRQYLAARDVQFGYEAWRRVDEGTTFGLIGDLSLLRKDEPFSEYIEQRSSYGRPSIRPVISGPMPLIFTERMRYGIDVIYSFEETTEDYRSIVDTGLEQVIDGEGTLLPAPDVFHPIDVERSTFGGGGSVRYDFGSTLQAGAGIEIGQEKIRAENEGVRNGMFIEEDRPIAVGQAALRGAIGPQLQWIVDGKGWTSSSEQSWRFTASGGQGGTPLNGRGKLLERAEEGSRLTSRVRYVAGAIELGGSFNTAYRQIEITPPGSDDLASFNYFRNTTYERAGTDSLLLPDSVVASTSERRSWGYGAGASWQSPWRSTLLGVEYHAGEDRLDQTNAGAGPKRVFWDVRAGAETPLNDAVRARAGFIYRSTDRDEFTDRNEYLSNAATLGLGVRPPAATWTLELGFMYEWFRGDFGDPAQQRGDRNQFAAQVRWDL